MSTLLSKIVADFTTQLATAISTGGTTASLQSATDDDSVALPTGQYLLTIDGNNSQKEYWLCDLSGTSLTNIQNVSRQGALTAGCLRDHRVGASVSITDFAHILYINDILTGVTDLDEDTPLKYAADPGITSSDLTSLATVQFVVDSTTAGAPDATNLVKGITKLSVAAVSPTNPIAVGDNDTRVSPVSLATVTAGQVEALAGTSGIPSTSNKYVTNDDTATTGVSKVLRSKADSKIDDSLVALTTAGDTVYSDGTDLQRLAIGSSGQAVTSNGTAPAWGNVNRRIASQTATVTVTNTTTETALLSGTLLANTISTNGSITGRIYITDFDTPNTGAETFSVRLKLGSTTIATLSIDINSTGVSNNNGYIDFTINELNSTSSQSGTISMYTFSGNQLNVSTVATPRITALASGTATEVTTANLTFSVTVQWANNSTSRNIVTRDGYATLISF